MNPISTKTQWLTVLMAFAIAVLAALTAVASPTVETPQGLRLAILDSDSSIALEEILTGRARLGFSPLVHTGITVAGAPGRSVWLRMRLSHPSEEAMVVTLPRQGIDRLYLYAAGATGQPVATTGIATPNNQVRWPSAFILPLPPGPEGESTYFLQVQGQGYLNLQPRIISAASAARQAASTSRSYGLLYGGLVIVALLAMLRRWVSGVRTLRVGAAALACLIASAIDNYHLQLAIGGTSLASLPTVPSALWVMACGPLLWATQQYAGHEKNFPDIAVLLDWAGLGFLAVGIGLLFVPTEYITLVQGGSLALLGVASLICGSSLFYDPRHWRWSPILIWLGFIPALLAIVLSMLQLIPSTLLVRRGFQMLLAVQLGVYLLLPWIRRALQERAKLKRSIVPEPTAADKIAHAREWVISSLQASIENASDSDMKWIAYRRLMGGLKPVLAQTAAAVIAMNYHNEDLLLVEPKSAEARFKMLLAQRGSLLKNLSRSLAPQQIGVDFNGPDGPLQQVLLAIIPLPIDRPGWGALVIERSDQVTYSDEELDLCTEFAALATTAGDEAAQVMQLRQANEIDAESGVYRREMFDHLLRKAQDVAIQKRKPLSVLHLSLDGFEAIPTDIVVATVRRIADIVLDEIEYGESIVRMSDDGFVVLLSGRALGDARGLGERICEAVRKAALPIDGDALLMVSLGTSQMQPGERSPQLMMDRSVRALGKARQYGGNQIQAIASSTI